jgi:hypothetical protein
MHIAFLGLCRKCGQMFMGLPVFQASKTREVLVERLAMIRKKLPSKVRIPTIPQGKTDGRFTLPINKAADSKNFFAFHALSMFEGFLTGDHWGLLVLTVRIARALASGLYYTPQMATDFHNLVIQHHALYCEVFGARHIVPNHHSSALI